MRPPAPAHPHPCAPRPVPAREWLARFRRAVGEASGRAVDRLESIELLGQLVKELADMEYDFLTDESRNLLVIGYNLAERRRDATCYDLLASEARLARLVAIAQRHPAPA